MNFTTRIDQREIMDEEVIGRNQLRSAYQDINRSNKMLGGYLSTYTALHKLWSRNPTDTIKLLDIGCGDGAMLRYLATRFRKKGVNVSCIGIDLNQRAIDLARHNSEGFGEIEFLVADILNLNQSFPRHDYVLCTLTMHHFSDHEIPILLQECKKYCKKAIVINDLQRSKAAYYLFKFFSAIFIVSSVAKNDGLVSIRKGFVRDELETFAEPHEGWDHQIKWSWAFRYVWVMENNRPKEE
ncbi:MAG: methyltransferase domain-containing protein [Flavobacteriaceae bacterium]